MTFIEEWNSDIPEYTGVEHGTLAASWNPKGPYSTESLEIICKESGHSLYVSMSDLKELIRKVEQHDYR